MNSSPRHRLPSPISKDKIALFSALLGIGLSSWVNQFWGLKAGAAAIVVGVLIGISAYKLGVLGCHWWTTLRRMVWKNSPSS